MFDRPLKSLTVCVENEEKEDIVIIFTEPSLKELEYLLRDKLVVGLVSDLLWINKEEDVGDGEDFKEEMVEKREGLNEEEEKINGGCKEEGIEEYVDLESKDKELGRGLVGCNRGQKARRKGEELWLEMWGKEMECREVEREKERRIMENQRYQMKTEDFGDTLESHESKLLNLLAQSMDEDHDTNNLFDLDYSIKEEVKNQDEEKMFPCDICGNFLSTMKSLKRHRKIHTRGTEKTKDKDDLNVTDTFSGKAVKHLKYVKTANAAIKQEAQNSTEDKKSKVQKEFPCEFCGKILKRRKTLNEHRKIHTGRIPKECNVCGKQSFGTYSYKVHMRTHTGERPHVCDVCGKAFITTTQLVCHRRIHTGEKPYTCDICKREFADISSCKRHKITHTGEKPFSCELCGKLFTASQTLKEHMRSHAAEKLSYPCVVCGKGFSFKRNLRRHMQKNHKGEKIEYNETIEGKVLL